MRRTSKSQEFVSSRYLSIVAALLLFFVLPASADEEGGLEHRVSHILVATKELAYEIRNEILRGDDVEKVFRAAARKHSQDAATKPLGGLIGWVKEGGEYDVRVTGAALRTKKGKVSAPVRSEFGWHLIFVHETRGAGPAPKIDPKDEIRGDLERPKNDEKAVRVVERFLKAIGGRKTIAAIEDRTHRFTNTKIASSGNTEAKIAVFQKVGGKLREDWDIVGFKIKGAPLAFTQTYDGTNGWVSMTGTVTPLVGRTLTVFVWEKHLGHGLADWKRDGYSLRHVGRDEVEIGGIVSEEGKVEKVEVVERVDFTGRQKIRYSFARGSGLLLKKSWYDVKDGVTHQKESYFDDYRPIAFSDKSKHKLRVSHRERIYVDGKFDTVRTYTGVSFNSGLEDTIFGKPDLPEYRPEGGGAKKEPRRKKI